MTLLADRAHEVLAHIRTAGHAPYDGDVRAGTRVEVRGRFESKWSRGFEVADCLDAEHDATGKPMYKVRRRSDGSILPVSFPESDLREENRRSTWWI